MRKKLHQTPMEYANNMVLKHNYYGFEKIQDMAHSELCEIFFSAHPFKRSRKSPLNQFIRSSFIEYNNQNGIENK